MKRLTLASLSLLIWACPARAYVRTRTSTGTPIAWRQHCPQLVLDSGENPDVPTARLRAALVASANAWNLPTAQCANPRISVNPGTSQGKGVAYDDTNNLIWRRPGYCDDGEHDADEVCVSPGAAAVTTLFFYDKPGDSKDGELLQVDIELNAARFTFGDDGSADKIDLQNTLTHELGHVLGLDHTCYTIAGGKPPQDDRGAPVPSCFPLTRLPPEVTAATMFNFESPGEISKRMPRADETGGICAVYQGGTITCDPLDAGGCQLVPRRLAVPVGAGVLMLAFALLVVSRCRRTRS